MGLLVAAPATAATIHGLVYVDENGDGLPSPGEPGVANARVALGVTSYATTDAHGQFELKVEVTDGIVWVRVPNGFVPGPVWARWDGGNDVDLALHRLPAPVGGPLTFTVVADTHIAAAQDIVLASDLADAALSATALDPPPAFFTILGDITQGNQQREFELVDIALSGLTVPFIPVPGNHDWYDGGRAWFAHYGPDNYSFDLGDVHFVVWNMAMSDDDIRSYLGAELQAVPKSMTIVALTHAPPTEAVIDALRELGVAYVLTGHAHSNRVVDHGGVIELNSEPFLMGGLDFTPAGYRVITLEHGRLASEHRATLDEPLLSVVAPAHGQCAQSRGTLIVAAALDAGPPSVTARVDCGTPVALRAAGGWSWQVELPALAAGTHSLVLEASTPSGDHATVTTAFEICDPGPPPVAGADWPQLGGDAAHRGARTHEIAPPLVTRWTTSVGGHVLTASPVIANGAVYVAVTDLADGNTGGVVALDLITGAVRWRFATPIPVRGALAIAGTTVIAARIDGVVVGLDAVTGTPRWRHALSAGIDAQAGALFGSPTVEQGDVLVGTQRAVASLSASTGGAAWTVDPIPDGKDSQSLAAIAVDGDLAVGTFNRALGGLFAWDAETGHLRWRYAGAETVAINASPVMAGDLIFIANAGDHITAFERTGEIRWRLKLDPAGFEWGNATIGTPAYAHGTLVVPTLYRDLVAIDAATGAELWRYAAIPGPLRTTHYRGPGEAAFEASPVITGDVVWAVDTNGELTALDLASGKRLWRTRLGVPVLAGLAASGDWLVAASFDGTVRALAPTLHERAALTSPTCTQPAASGCCDAGSPGTSTLGLVVLVGFVMGRRRSVRIASRCGII